MSERVLVVDDELLGRKSVLRALAATLPNAVVEEAPDGVAALERVRSFAPMLLFLDVEMPELDGIQVLRQLPDPRPKVVFVTAYEQFATTAFAENACDYLVKPFTAERFAAVVARARSELDGERRLRAFEEELSKGGRWLERLALRTGSRVDVVATDDVSALVSRGHYTYVLAHGKEWISELSLIHYESRLDPAKFCRAHRAALVNRTHVVRIQDGAAPVVELRGRRHRPGLAAQPARAPGTCGSLRLTLARKYRRRASRRSPRAAPRPHRSRPSRRSSPPSDPRSSVRSRRPPPATSPRRATCAHLSRAW